MNRIYNKLKFLQGLISGDKAKTGPFYVDVDLTGRCNLRCLGCVYHSGHVGDKSKTEAAKKDMPISMFQSLCSDLKQLQTHSLIFQGSGEPFLHDNILEMLSIAKESGFHVTIITNATMLDMDIMKSLIDLRLDTLKVSLWASSVDEYRKNYPGTNPDYFDKVINSLQLLTSLKAERKSSTPLLQLHHPINRHNFRNIDEFVNLGVKVGCNTFSFSPFWTVKGEVASATLSEEEEEATIRSLKKNRKRLKHLAINEIIDETLLRYKLGSSAWKKLPCYAAWYHARVRVDGKVQPCGRCGPEVNFGNLKNDSFQNIWNSEPVRSFRRTALDPGTRASMMDGCDCDYCCFVTNNLQVHKIYKWISPIVSAGGRRKIAIEK